MSSKKSYEYWDQMMSSRNPDYATICKQIHALAPTMGAGDAELWWRASAATFGLTYSMDFASQRPAIKAKTLEAKGYAEKALAADPKNFGANLWMAKCLAQLAIFQEGNLAAALALLGPLMNHLDVARSLEPTHWRLLLLESQLQVTMHEQKALVRKYQAQLPANLKMQDLATVEGKLHRVLEQRPESIEAFLALTIVLYMQGNYLEALATGQQGLTLDRVNKGEEYVARTLQGFLPDIARKMEAA